MNKLALAGIAALLLTACPNPTPNPNPQPTATGGDTSTGGSTSVGGSGTGGSTSPCANFVAPTYDNLVGAKKAEHHKFGKRHFRPKIRGVEAAVAATQTSACSQWHERNVAQFDQGPVGSCTGNADLGTICTQPFTDTSRCTEDFAVQAYQGGTCVDNGCSLSKCSCSGCPKAYCPATGANDNGSTGSSVFTWMKANGWITDFVTADTEADLTAGIQKTACTVGINFPYSMETIGSTCQAVVNAASGIAGGHEIEIVGMQLMPDGSKRWWFDNSWGIWGCKDAKGYYGFAWISNDDLFGNVLQMDGDCPILKQ
jgi:hypothetical protein